MTNQSKYTGSYRGIGSMLRRPWLMKPCRDAAVRMKGIAESIAPVGNPAEDRHPGLYKASLDVLPIYKDVRFRGRPHNRPGARLINTAPHAWRVEYGDGRVPRYAVLQRTIDAAKGV
ncbi:hypothetical protein NPS70_16540 [Streptomyces sp. C10-9-1]|uniref:hypothetical protein n=1 Tax=Streptomyces sp. C10-9-1 TaxID=1859285 RepID=UPI00211362CB|nr:hypothetical protein [Streptomyces sp. C10-9-1]MCQ6554795.1 hypothetical protein [Streptomyces sp. C10-9-1]